MPKTEKQTKENKLLEEMIQAGMHLGHHTSRLHPKMAKYVLGIRNTIHVLDLKKTSSYLNKALKFIEELTKKNGKLLFVGTKLPLRNLVREIAKECNAPYVVERWLGGTFTNFEIISKRAKYFKEYQERKKRGEFNKYTKKERIRIERDLENLRKKFEGIKDMEKLPEAIFICDIVKDKLALKEAKIKGIRTIAIVDTNADPTLVDFPIPANDDALTSVRYILEKVKKVIKKHQQKNKR